MAPPFLTKTEEVPPAAVCTESYADSLLRWTRHHFWSTTRPGGTLSPVPHI
jgi:hypothetical protein